MTARALPQPVDGPCEGLRLDDYLPYRLSVASSSVSRLIARAYEDRFGLSVPQWRVVCVLAEDGAMNDRSLVSRTGMGKVTVGRAVQGLGSRDLVARSDSADDGRAPVVSLTGEGLRLHAEIAPLALAYEAALISGLAPQEVALLKRLLQRLQGAAGMLAGERDGPSPD